MDKINEILDFWFGPVRGESTADPAEQYKLWFAKSDETDQTTAERFEQDWKTAVVGGYKDWEESREGRLAKIILLDQFPRNMFRGKPESFASDALALELSFKCLDLKDHEILNPVEAIFIYLPLEHAESLDYQDQCVGYSEGTLRRAENEQYAGLKFINGAVDYALKHRDVIKQFGRFPHRNAILGRESTPAERAFLQQPGSSF